MKVKVYAKGEMLAARLRSAGNAALHISQEQAHAQMRRNGSIPQPNPWANARGPYSAPTFPLPPSSVLVCK